MKKILIINGHPNSGSYCAALLKQYAEGAISSGNEVETIHLHQLNFNLNLAGGYEHATALEPDLIDAQNKIKWSNHIVIVFPTWWGSTPALLKGFLDRVLLPGFAFKYRKNSPLWDKLLKEKSARIIYTLDYPIWYYQWILKQPAIHQLKKMTLEFCGIGPVSVNAIGPIRTSTLDQREKWLQKIFETGKNE